jgi:hypothetical protein
MTLPEKTQQAFADYERAKKQRKEIASTIKDAKAADTTLSELDAAKKQAAADYKAERSQFEAKHETLLEQLDDAKRAEDEAKALFDALYVHAAAESITTGEVQLSLFADDGRKVQIDLVTKIRVEKVTKSADEASEVPAEAEAVAA